MNNLTLAAINSAKPSFYNPIVLKWKEDKSHTPPNACILSPVINNQVLLAVGMNHPQWHPLDYLENFNLPENVIIMKDNEREKLAWFKLIKSDGLNRVGNVEPVLVDSVSFQLLNNNPNWKRVYVEE